MLSTNQILTKIFQTVEGNAENNEPFSKHSKRSKHIVNRENEHVQSNEVDEDDFFEDSSSPGDSDNDIKSDYEVYVN